MMENKPIEKIYSAEEAADRLHIPKRLMMKLGRDFNACTKVGQKYLFTESDLETIWAKQRAASTEEFRRWRELLNYRSEGEANNDGSAALKSALATLRSL